MRTVECPVCRCTVEGTDESDLSSCIHVHFCEEHGMEREGRGMETRTERGAEGSMEESSGEWRWAETPTIVGGTMNESSTRFEARGTSASSGARTSSSAGSPETSPTASREAELGVDCPGCRERVSGRSEEEVSASLREHMETTHSQEPYMTRLMEKMKGR